MENLNEHQLTHLHGAQPVLASFDAFWCFWTFLVKIAQGMSKRLTCRRETREEKHESQNTPPSKKYHKANLLGGHRSSRIFTLKSQTCARNTGRHANWMGWALLHVATLPRSNNGNETLLHYQRMPKGGQKGGGGQYLLRGKSFRPPSPQYVLPPPNFISLVKSSRSSQNFPQVTPSETGLRGSPNMVFEGPSSRGFALRYIPPRL